jgi:diguanylate cyclase
MRTSGAPLLKRLRKMTIAVLTVGDVQIWGLTLVALPTSAALAAVALLGYMFGKRTRKSTQAELDDRRQREFDRAARIAWQLESIAKRLRGNLAFHHSQVESFKRRLRRANEDDNEQSWQQLCAEAETILGPTMQLAQQLSHAYDEIRQQSDALETFTQGRTDPLTGVGNGRALEGQLQVLLSPATRNTIEFVVAIVSMDRDGANSAGRVSMMVAMLPRLAGVIRSCMRDSDFVARFGEDEFVVVMPQTSVAGATVFGDRLQARVAAEMNTTICCGMAMALTDDDSKSILTRADSALYSAKAAGTNRLFVHTGTQIREHRSNAKSEALLSATRAVAPAAISPEASRSELVMEPQCGSSADVTRSEQFAAAISGADWSDS